MVTATYDLPQHIDSTMLSAFKSCHQKYFREYGQGLRPDETSVDLHFGGVFSATLERINREIFISGADTSTALARGYATATSEWGDFIIRKEKSPKTFDNLWTAVEQYISTYPPRTDLVQPFFTEGSPSFEFSFAIPLDFPGFPRHPISGDPFVYVGRFDMFGKWRGTTPVVRDEKTASRLESNWAEKWNLRSQFLGYCWALQHNGIPCDTVIIRGVIVTLNLVRQVEAIKKYPQFLIDRWFHELRDSLNALVKCHETGYWNYNLGESCVAYSHCPYMDLCSSPQPENWLESFAVRRWNPLSRNPVSSEPTSIPLNFSARGSIPEKYKWMEEVG